MIYWGIEGYRRFAKDIQAYSGGIQELLRMYSGIRIYGGI